MKSLEIPGEFLELCEQWHSGQSSMFYAISSTGALSLGTHSPVFGEPMSDEVWMLTLIDGTISEIEDCVRILLGRINSGMFSDDDSIDLDLFEGFQSYMEIKKLELEKTVLVC